MNLNAKISMHISDLLQNIRVIKEKWFGKENPRVDILFEVHKDDKHLVMIVCKSYDDLGILKQKFKWLRKRQDSWYIIPKIAYVGRVEPDKNPNHYWMPLIANDDKTAKKYIERFKTWDDLLQFYWENYQWYLADWEEFERYKKRA